MSIVTVKAIDTSTKEIIDIIFDEETHAQYGHLLDKMSFNPKLGPRLLHKNRFEEFHAQGNNPLYVHRLITGTIHAGNKVKVYFRNSNKFDCRLANLEVINW